jgi:hypothetical protein
MKVKNCGGPLICRKCSMQWAQKYYEQGKTEWAEIYRQHAITLLNKNKR